MSAATTIGAGALQLGGAAAAPLLAGGVQRLKARLQGRRGPSPLQPYRDLRRLWRKSGVAPAGASPLYGIAPPLVAASVLVALLLVPVAGKAADWGLGHDALVLLALLALGRFALTLSAWESRSGFALMGASRELTIAVFAEAVLVLALLPLMLDAGPSSDLLAMAAAGSQPAAWGEPAHWCAALALALVAIAEAGRMPVDNPDTHLELTMIHEGPLLEYAGRELACLQWAASARLWLLALLGAGLVAPGTGPFALRLALLAAALVVLAAALAVTESVLAKMRLLRVPVFLAGAGALALIGLGSLLVGSGG
jgi:formate hydrogenlyase subunit 4